MMEGTVTEVTEGTVTEVAEGTVTEVTEGTETEATEETELHRATEKQRRSIFDKAFSVASFLCVDPLTPSPPFPVGPACA
jgi:hypothetical protein